MKENQPLKPPPSDGEAGDLTAAGDAQLAQLDAALALLAQRYARLPARPEPEQKTRQTRKPFTRALSDGELEWLSAAGSAPAGGVPGGDPDLDYPKG